MPFQYIFSNYKVSNVHIDFFSVFTRFRIRPIHNNFCRLPREARFVIEGKPINDVKVLTSRAVSPGSVALHSTGIPPDAKSIRIVLVPTGPVIVPLNLLYNNPIQPVISEKRLFWHLK